MTEKIRRTVAAVADVVLGNYIVNSLGGEK